MGLLEQEKIQAANRAVSGVGWGTFASSSSVIRCSTLCLMTGVLVGEQHSAW